MVRKLSALCPKGEVFCLEEGEDPIIPHLTDPTLEHKEMRILALFNMSWQESTEREIYPLTLQLPSETIKAIMKMRLDYEERFTELNQILIKENTDKTRGYFAKRLRLLKNRYETDLKGMMGSENWAHFVSLRNEFSREVEVNFGAKVNVDLF